jgi:phosphatidylglycerophosphatase A
MKRMLTSCFGLGLLPVAPGTWGSLPPAVIFLALGMLAGRPVLSAVVMGLLAVGGSVVCVACSPAVVEAVGKQDPGEIVADEVAGQSLAYAVIFAGSVVVPGAIGQNQWCIAAAGGFLLFRVFDIIKPSPCRTLEKLPRGWGILADDLVAGLYAGLGLVLLMKLVNAYSGAMEL